MPFSTLAATLEALEPVTSRTQMITMLAELLAQADPEEVAELVYLVQGRLLPEFVQKEFGMNERLILRAISQAYGVPLEEVMARFKKLGDVGLVAQEVVGQSPQQQQPTLFQGDGHEAQSKEGSGAGGEGGLSLKDVYTRLMQITQTVGAGSQEAKVKILAALLARLSPLEAKHVTRIVVGRLRVGVGDPTLMDALSVARAGDKSLRAAIERAYNLSSDLGLVARTLYASGVEGLESIQVRVGNPVRMALAERADSAEEIVARLGRCAVEPKYDGFRMQVHKDGDNITIFSRGLENLSGMFPEVVDAVCKQVSARQAILEGEALAYDPETGIFYPFQITAQRRRIHNIDQMSANLPLRLIAFDLLLLEGKDLTRSPYIQRRESLVGSVAARNEHGGLQVTEAIITDNPEEILVFYEECLTEGLEGIIAKRLDGTYEAGKRGFNWIKMKRSYQTQLSDTVDCVIVGYYYGKGRRASWGIGSLLVSVYDPQTDTLPTITRVASGLSEQQWQELGKRLEADRIDHPDPRVNAILKPDVWVVPRYVVEITADEISRSQMHTAGKTDDQPGYALRFPRIVRERPDRNPEDATTVQEILELYQMQGKGDKRGVRKSADSTRKGAETVVTDH
jgi:DNA ligase-1